MCLNQVIRVLEALLRRRIGVTHVAPQRGDVRHTSADIRLAAEVLDYAPTVDLEAGLAAEVEWLASHNPPEG